MFPHNKKKTTEFNINIIENKRGPVDYLLVHENVKENNNFNFGKEIY